MKLHHRIGSNNPLRAQCALIRACVLFMSGMALTHVSATLSATIFLYMNDNYGMIVHILVM